VTVWLMVGSWWHWRVNGVYVAGHCEYAMGQSNNFNFRQCTALETGAKLSQIQLIVCCLISCVGDRAEVIR